MKAHCQAYIEEAKCLHEKYIPTYDECMKTAHLSLGYTSLTGVAFLGMGRLATDEAFQWTSQTVGPVKESCVIGRLMSDVASRKVCTIHLFFLGSWILHFTGVELLLAQ